MHPGYVDTVVVRMDKIGDLALSLPVDRHPVLSGPHVHWFITRGLNAIAARAEPARAATAFARKFSPFEFLRVYAWFRRHRPRTIFLLHNPWWVSMAAWAAGVPERVGRLSQWHSFLFVNLRVRQKRSRADRHESDFNFDLVEWGAVRLGHRPTRDLARLKTSALKLHPVDPQRTLASLNLSPREYRVVHPGMAGSALNWPPEHFAALIERFAAGGPVVITGTKADQKYLAQLDRVKDLPEVRWLVDRLNLDQLFDVLAEARAVVAPSTGVLHLAAALGTRAVGIYSCRGVEHPRRWGPKGPRATYVVASEGGAADEDPMRRISVDEVERLVHQIENEGPR